MTRKTSVTGTVLKHKYPQLILWHYLDHRLELAVSDAIDDVCICGYMQGLGSGPFSVQFHVEFFRQRCSSESSVFHVDCTGSVMKRLTHQKTPYCYSMVTVWLSLSSWQLSDMHGECRLLTLWHSHGSTSHPHLPAFHRCFAFSWSTAYRTMYTPSYLILMCFCFNFLLLSFRVLSWFLTIWIILRSTDIY